jgi:hypothetical protein
MAELAYERQAVRQQMQRAAELYEEGLYDREKFSRVQGECRRQLKALEPSGTFAGEEAAHLLENLPVLWDALTDEEKNHINRILLNGVYVKGKAIAEIEPQRPFHNLLEDAADRLAASAGEVPYQVVDVPSPPDADLVALLER